MSQLTDYQRGLVAQLRSLSLQDPPAPWRYVTRVHVGGLFEVGYGTEADLLLVVSADGRGIFDCLSGEHVARNKTDVSIGDWYQPLHLLARGIGPLKTQMVRIAGIHGGGLLMLTHDGWELELVTLDWPFNFAILRSPNIRGNTFYSPEAVTKVAPHHGNNCVRAYGFSPTGRSFVVAFSDGIDIFSRSDGPHITDENLEAAYRQMAEDEAEEAEALEWAEAFIGDTRDDP